MELGIGHLLALVLGIMGFYWLDNSQNGMWRDDDWLDNSQNDMWKDEEEEEEKEKQKKQKEKKKPIEQMEQEEERKLMEQKKQKRKQKKQELDASTMPVQLTTRDLVLQTLREMGCKYSEEFDGTLIHFSYQGKVFFVEAHNDCPYIYLLDPWWYEMSMDGDIEDFACMQKAVNEVNSYGKATVYYSFDEEDRTISLSSRQSILFVEEIKCIDNYLAAVLDVFFRVQQKVLTEMEKYRVRAGLV